MKKIVALGELKHATTADQQIVAMLEHQVRQFHRTHSSEYIFSVIAELEKLSKRLQERWDAINLLIEQEAVAGEKGNEQDRKAS